MLRSGFKKEEEEKKLVNYRVVVFQRFLMQFQVKVNTFLPLVFYCTFPHTILVVDISESIHLRYDYYSLY